MIWTHWCHAGMAPHDAGFGEDQPLPTARWGLVYLGGQQCHGYGALMAHGAATCRSSNMQDRGQERSRGSLPRAPPGASSYQCMRSWPGSCVPQRAVWLALSCQRCSVTTAAVFAAAEVNDPRSPRSSKSNRRSSGARVGANPNGNPPRCPRMYRQTEDECKLLTRLKISKMKGKEHKIRARG